MWTIGPRHVDYRSTNFHVFFSSSITHNFSISNNPPSLSMFLFSLPNLTSTQSSTISIVIFTRWRSDRPSAVRGLSRPYYMSQRRSRSGSNRGTSGEIAAQQSEHGCYVVSIRLHPSIHHCPYPVIIPQRVLSIPDQHC